MIEKSYGEVTLLQFERLAAEPRLVHAVTTRPQNYAPHRGRGSEQANHWRRRVCEILDISYDRLTSPAQVHGADVLRIEECDIGCGRDGRSSAVANVDGLCTDRLGVPMIVLSADCPLVCVYDPALPAVGAVHASWKGTVAGAAGHLVRRMQREFGSEPGRLLAAIAPSAGPCCYEIGPEVRRLARTRLDEADTFFIECGGRLHFDLWTANRCQLAAAGIPADHIETAGLCSICDHRFWSHRRDGDAAGRFALFLALR